MTPRQLPRQFADRDALATFLLDEFASLTPAVTLPLSPIRGGRRAAEARLALVAPREYRDTRNHVGGRVTRLSPYLRHGILSLAEVRDVALARAAAPGEADKLVGELGWRDYWRRVYADLGDAVWEDREPYKTGFTADDYVDELPPEVSAGTTGLACMDAFTLTLRTTGYLHNHARMWFASIWIFTLRLPWQLGADFFLRHLLDGDPASNTLSWRWVAGLQTVGKTYLATADNIARYTDGRFRPRGLATVAHAVDDDAAVPPAGPAPVPEPLPRATRVALLLHEDDLHAESLPTLPPEVTVVGVAAPTAGEPRSPLAATAAVPARFTAAALADGLARAAAYCRSSGTAAPAEHLPALHPDTVIAWLRGLGAEALLTPHAPVGPTRDRLDGLAAALRAEGIPLHRRLRGWDARAWPHAHRGFFPFKERIPALLREEQMFD